MTDAQLALRRPPGPDQPVTLGLDAETLATLESKLIDEAQRFVPNVSAISAESLSAMEHTQMVLEKVHLGLLLPRFRMSLIDDAQPELELAVNLRAAEDIHVRPETR